MNNYTDCTRQEHLFLENVGENIRKYRLQKEIPMSELCKKVGRKYGTIMLYEKGESVMSLVMLKRVADALEISVEKLIEKNT